MDETGLDAWDIGPPYATGPPSNSLHEIAHTERMKEVVHGRRIRLQREQETEWRCQPLEILNVLLQATVDEWEIG